MKEHKEFSELSLDLKESITHFIHNFNTEGSHFIKPGRNTIKSNEILDLTVNVKSFKVPHLLNQFAYKYFRKSKARRSFENACYLLKMGIGTPRPLAYFEYFSSFGLKKSFYVSEHLDCDLTFRELITNPEYPDWEKILIEATDFTFKLHENKILFKDHSPGNTLIKKQGSNYQFYLVDLNRMSFKSLSFEERIKNFSRLTPKKNMVEIMSKRYAELIKRDPKEVFELMWKYTKKFQMKYHRKRKLKKKLGLKK
ncbi:MAG: Kdo domain containing protein [Flavobacteriaceae bacterium]|nr:Kdo domain containing protein [Flavobacteriaceae bacterium]